MGCGASRLDGNGMVLPPRLRPLFLHRLEEIKLRRHAPLKDSASTASKKELLLDDIGDEDENASSSYKIASKNMPQNCPKDQVMIYDDKDEDSKIIDDLKAKEAKVETETEMDADNVDDDDHDDDDDDERMIGHDDDRNFPGSPSFRVYFKDEGREDTGKIKDASKKSAIPNDASVPSKESSEKKKVKKGRKKNKFKKSAVKNLLSVKSCYNSPHSANHHPQLLTGKTTA